MVVDMDLEEVKRVSARAPAQLGGTQLLHQLPDHWRQTALHVRLADTVQLARQHLHALVLVQLADTRLTPRLQDPRPPTASHAMQDDTVQREPQSHSALVIVQQVDTR